MYLCVFYIYIGRSRYSLDVATATFIGHSIALYTTDDYLAKPSVRSSKLR